MPEFSDVKPNQSEPCLVDQGKSGERVTDPPPHSFVPPVPLVSKTGKMATGHIPKQKDLHRIIHNIQRIVMYTSRTIFVV